MAFLHFLKLCFIILFIHCFIVICSLFFILILFFLLTSVFCIFQLVDMVDSYLMQLCFPRKFHKKIFTMAFLQLCNYHNITRGIINQNLSVNFINLESCTKWLVGSIVQKSILKTCVELPCCFSTSKLQVPSLLPWGGSL